MSKALAVCHGEFGRVVVYQLNRSMATHVHREGHLLFYLKGARPSVWVDGEATPVGPGQAAAVNPWEPHEFHTCPSGADCLFLIVYVDPDWIKKVGADWDAAVNFSRPDLQVTLEMMREITGITETLRKQMSETEEAERRTVDDGAVSASLLRLVKMCLEQSWAGKGTDIVRSNMDSELHCTDPRVRKALSLMRAEPANDVSLDQIARDAGLSRPHFFKLFKEQTGITPNLYLNTLRMERAIEYLADSEMSVTEIAYDLGFASQASFTRFFSMNVGIPPSDYRRVISTEGSAIH